MPNRGGSAPAAWSSRFRFEGSGCGFGLGFVPGSLSGALNQGSGWLGRDLDIGV